MTGACGGGTALNPGRTFSGHLQSSGAIGGVQGGYNWHFSPAWVLGVEADFDGGGLDGTQSTLVTTLPAPLIGTNTRQVSQTERYLGTVRGRLGWLPTPSWLIYGTGGFAYGQINSSTLTSFSSAGDTYSGRASSNKSGWTAGGGTEYAINPQWSLKLEYLYVDLGSTGYNDACIAACGATVPAPAYHTSQNDREHVIRVGVNYHFGAPPPPPPVPAAMPAPPPAAPRVFIVFFDWDRDTITPEGQAIIQQAADAYRSGAPVQIQVTGYTDRSGSPGYNQRLSERRANNVARALAALGVPREQMAVSGRGENDNRVPTAPGVREPQNRRVEIISP
jgi:outer membrane protein OmpA-like peptidoglycan-associated protein